MSENPPNNDGEDDNPMTLDDFIEEETKLVKDAIAVLGSSDDKNCTYNSGYVKRQALYACVTCAPQNSSSSKPAGICLACSYHCHEGHDLIELYTKRLFRCDCGNSKFLGKKCNLEPNKLPENENNTYNQNFNGLYCTCARPYPDPDDDTPDEMIQCIICEDWYHTRHLHSGLGVGSLSNNYSEMICGACTKRLAFLKYYSGYAVSPILKNDNADNSATEINVECTQNASPTNVSNDKAKDYECDTNVKTSGDDITESNNTISSDNAVITDKGTLNGPTSKPIPEQTEAESCLLNKLKPLDETDFVKNATFWPSSFRSSLCTCSSCKKLYSELNIPWILDETDMVQAYEENSENVANDQAEGLLNNELAKFNRFQQVELIQNYNDFKTSLSEFLGKFAQEKKVVRKQDIDDFFEDMQAKKRHRAATPPYNCH